MPRLHYYVVNAGDGSAHPRFCPSAKDAKRREEADIEATGEGWGEPSAGFVELRIEDGRIMARSVDDEYNEIWFEVK